MDLDPIRFHQNALDLNQLIWIRSTVQLQTPGIKYQVNEKREKCDLFQKGTVYKKHRDELMTHS
jgi:hypothetical protein